MVRSPLCFHNQFLLTRLHNKMLVPSSHLAAYPSHHLLLTAAKLQYKSVLANVDWLHGTAESFLTLTNLLIGEQTTLTAFRNGSDSPPICMTNSLDITARRICDVS